MIKELEPTEPVEGSAYALPQTLPRQLPESLRKLDQSEELREILGNEFINVLLAVKQAEHDAYQSVISSWEREHLLLNV